MEKAVESLKFCLEGLNTLCVTGANNCAIVATLYQKINEIIIEAEAGGNEF